MHKHIFMEDNGIRIWLGMRPQLHVEFYWLTGRFGAGIEFDPGGEGDIKANLSLALFSLYVDVSSSAARRLVRWLIPDGYEGRSTGFRVFENAVWWDVWHTTDSWRSGTPKWRNGSWHPLDTIFGRTVHSERELFTTNHLVQMPERAYPCVTTMKAERWQRPRLPWASHKVIRAHIDVPGGIPFPGKGENAWDCGEDAAYSMCCPAPTPQAGAERLAASVIRDRIRNGGAGWRPAAIDAARNGGAT